MKKTILATALTTAVSFGIVADAQAKDPYNATSDLAGNKTLVVDIKGSAKLGIKPASWSEKIDILHRGYTEIDMFSNDGVTSIETEFGLNNYRWEDADGLTYVIEDYPENNEGAPVTGGVYAGKRAVGKFRILSTKHGVHRASGRWAGELAFPGGGGLDMSLQVSSTPQQSSDDCVTYDVRVSFPGHAYEQTSFYQCEEDPTLYGTGFFHVDSVTGESWFIHMNAAVENGAFQGEVYILSLSGNGSSWGKVYTERPTSFGL